MYSRASENFYPKALAVLPKETELKKVRSFLEKVIEQQAMQWRHGQVLKSLRHAELLQVTLFNQKN